MRALSMRYSCDQMAQWKSVTAYEGDRLGRADHFQRDVAAVARVRRSGLLTESGKFAIDDSSLDTRHARLITSSRPHHQLGASRR